MANSESGQTRSARLVAMAEDAKASPFELFFDLVFVYAITQVTALMTHDATAHGVLRGLLALGLLWWCWSAYTWLGNTVRLDQGAARAGMFAVMAVMFVVALTIPEAFEDLPGGLSGPAVFVVCYVLVRGLHLVLYYQAARGDAGLRRQILKMLAPLAGGTVFLTLAAFASGWLQTFLWAAALAWDYTGVLLAGASGWRVRSASHWAERHGLILIIALGESIVAIGLGASAFGISWPIVVGAGLGILLACALWWIYFDATQAAAEERLTIATGVERATLASHGYTYLHLPLVTGIILVAFGMEHALAQVADVSHYTLTDSLHGIGLYALYGGAAVYLLGHAAFAARMFGRWKPARLIASAAVVVALPIANVVPALAALGLVVVILAGLAGYEWRSRIATQHPSPALRP